MQLGFALRNIVMHGLRLGLASWTPAGGSEGDQECNFPLLKYTKKLLLVTFCDQTAETGVSFRTHKRTNSGSTGAEGAQLSPEILDPRRIEANFEYFRLSTAKDDKNNEDSPSSFTDFGLKSC